MTGIEEWRPVVGHPYYEVSNLGRIKSLDKTILCADGRTRSFKGRTLKASPDKKMGYLRIAFLDKTVSTSRTVHSVVADAFLGLRPDGQEVRHKDGNPKNNLLDNLEYGTRTENMQDSLKHGTNARANKTHCPRNHKLVEGNLVLSLLEKGRRDCLACARAAGLLKGRKHQDFIELANLYYKDLGVE